MVKRVADLRQFGPIIARGVAALHYSGWSYVAWFVRWEKTSDVWAKRAANYLASLLEEMQKAYFRSTWFSDATITLIEGVGSVASVLIRAGVRTGLALNIEDRRKLSKLYWRVPRDGWESFWAGYLAIGEAAGYFRASSVHVFPVMISNKKVKPQQREGIPLPTLTRWHCPRNISDALLDIDDHYWNCGVGMPVKIIHVGDQPSWAGHRIMRRVNEVRGTKPRWIVVLSGTDHLRPESTTNPADSQTNLMESLHLKSLVRKGVEQALFAAMEECGVDPADEEVLMIGHSQGAMVSMEMANDSSLPFHISAVVSAGGPIGRIPVPDGLTVLALRHRQDVIPAFGGYEGEMDDHVVVIERSLPMPQSGVLYYAHAASTYADTAELLETMAGSIPHSRIATALKTIDSMFPAVWKAKGVPAISEPSRVFVYELIQDVEGAESVNISISHDGSWVDEAGQVIKDNGDEWIAARDEQSRPRVMTHMSGPRSHDASARTAVAEESTSPAEVVTKATSKLKQFGKRKG